MKLARGGAVTCGDLGVRTTFPLWVLPYGYGHWFAVSPRSVPLGPDMSFVRM